VIVLTASDSAKVGGVACFLASERSKFIAGEVVEVNGGFYFD
jgi:enoyl-[acyl-carrier-protein] reductase (NADH)